MGARDTDSLASGTNPAAGNNEAALRRLVVHVIAFAKLENLERAKGFEPSTPTLARSCSTTELHPHPRDCGDRSPATGRPMPNAAHECNSLAKGGIDRIIARFDRFHRIPGNPGPNRTKSAGAGFPRLQIGPATAN